jgi:hypothetical protein
MLPVLVRKVRREQRVRLAQLELPVCKARQVHKD